MPETSRALIPRIGVSAVSSPLEVGADRAAPAARELAIRLRIAGCDVVEFEAIGSADAAGMTGRKLAAAHVDAVVLAAASWFEDYLVGDLLEECAVPLLLWALPGMETGALCGVQQLTWYLKQMQAPYHCVYGPLDQNEALRTAMTFLRAAALRRRLRRARVGMAGHRVAGMSEVAVNEIALRRAIGPRVVPLDLPNLLHRAQELPAEQAMALWQSVVARSGSCCVKEAAGLESMRVYLAVKELVDQHKLDALTIGCYPHLMGKVCLAASLLADQGVPLGCEGDLNGAVGQLLLTLLSGQPTHNTDWLEPLPDGSVVLTHCGSGSLDLAESKSNIALQSVRLMGQGVCALFPARPGPVTLANLVPAGGGYQCALLEGEAVSTEMVFPGNPLRVRFTQPTSQLLQWIHEEGIGHHWMAAYGRYGAEVRAWAKIAGDDLRLIAP